MKTKLFAVFFAFLVLFTSCGKTTPSDAEETIPRAENTETAPDETEAPETQPSIPLAGSLEKCIYTNQRLGFSINLDGLICVPDSELGVISKEIIYPLEKTEAYKKYLENNPTSVITDLYAYCNSGLCGITLQFMNQTEDFSDMDDESILDYVLSTQKDTIISTFEQLGFQVESYEKTTVSFLGNEIQAYKGVFTARGLPYYTLQIPKYNLDGYLMTLTFSSYIEDYTDLLSSLCYPINGIAPNVIIPKIPLP